jgi:hypothetical protein
MRAGTQAEGEGVLLLPEHHALSQQLWLRQTSALERASPAAAAAAAAARDAAAKQLPDLPEQPSWVRTAHRTKKPPDSKQASWAYSAPPLSGNIHPVYHA